MIPPIRLLLRTLATILTLSFASDTALSQNPQRLPGYEDPEQLAISAEKRRIEQDESNVIVERIVLAERELEGRQIRRRIEALSFMSPDDISPRLQDYQSELFQKLSDLEKLIASSKQSISLNMAFLEERVRQLNVKEEEFKKRIADETERHGETSRDDFRTKIQEQNERLRQQSVQQRKDVALQNLRLIEEEARFVPTYQIPRPSAPSSPSRSEDMDELNLCAILEQKASEKDYDIAEINLLAAKGLPGAEPIDIDKSLKTLDLWAAWVKHETDRHLYKYRNAPGEYYDSEAYFRILMMFTVLQQDFEICYNKNPEMREGPVEVLPTDFSFYEKPKDLFLNGLTDAEHQGTCASMPVLYVAVGRRLGYPLKLVECKGHLFLRWEDKKERFNIEGTSRGLNCYPNEEYMEWPWPISKEELATGMYMKPLSPLREVADFLEMRALCLKHHGLTTRFNTVKTYADNLRKKEGVDLDKLNRIMRASANKTSKETVERSLLYHILTSTNSWRDARNKRGGNEKTTVFSSERFDSQ